MTDDTTQVTFVRHAESAMNLRRSEVIGGRSNHTPLSDEGVTASAALGRQVAHWDPAAVYCTSAVRSRQTADLLLEAAGWRLTPQTEDRFLELSQGVAEGLPREEWWTTEALDAMRADPLGHRLAPDGETHAEVQARMSAGLHDVAGAHPGRQVVAVGHGIAIRTLAWRLLGGGHDVFRDLPLPNLGQVTFEVDARTISLLGGTWPAARTH